MLYVTSLLQCPSKEAKEMRRAALVAFKAESKRNKILRPVMERTHHKRWEIQHGKENQAEEGNNLQLGDPIQWYVTKRHNVISVYDNRLATFNITTIHRMSQDQHRQLVEHLDIAQDAYSLESRQRGHNQNITTWYMVSANEVVHNTLESDCKNDIKTMDS